IARLVLADAVGLWIDEAPIGELFGSTPPEVAQMIFHDEEHPLAQMLRAMTSIADVPEDFAYTQLRALEAAAKVGWNPYLHDPKLEGRLRRVTAPTLVLWGRQDGLVPRVDAAETKAYLSSRLDQPSARRYCRMVDASGIGTRYSAVPADDLFRMPTLEERTREYIRHAVVLGEAATRSALDAAEVSPDRT